MTLVGVGLPEGERAAAGCSRSETHGDPAITPACYTDMPTSKGICGDSQSPSMKNLAFYPEPATLVPCEHLLSLSCSLT